jgi:hypothetical protein
MRGPADHIRAAAVADLALHPYDFRGLHGRQTMQRRTTESTSCAYSANWLASLRFFQTHTLLIKFGLRIIR